MPVPSPLTIIAPSTATQRAIARWVALDRTAGETLQPPAHAAQQLPGVAGMEAVPGGLLDHGGAALKGPAVGVEPVRAGALAQLLVQVVELLIRQTRVRPGGAALASACSPPACQRAYQRLTIWRATPRVRATSAWMWPAANS
jgi:hypothetical protein